MPRPRNPVRLLVACGRLDFARALSSGITAASHGDISGTASDMRWFSRKLEVLRPDVLLVEHAPQEEERLWEVLAGAGEPARILLLCRTCSHSNLADFVRHDVSGCVMASSSPDHLARAVLAVHRGEPWFRRSSLLRALRLQVAEAPPRRELLAREGSPLTAREREVLDLVGTGLSNKQIGRRLEISDKTVKTHLHNIYRKLHGGGRYTILLSHRAGTQPAGSLAGAV